ncbi:protein DNA-DAMAGE INDUCIBLE 1-like [Hibiscus syriacus]|uniref:protein DNA-DAMAGE INDUCIBLE 1-like n=1 Tax=Hibiscus syriacus TaxID=106335 RepID=UPI001921E92E|nr:protein DNA-DAMAGE INDUCIBLE 1-like [Hibiscus syriacus]
MHKAFVVKVEKDGFAGMVLPGMRVCDMHDSGGGHGGVVDRLRSFPERWYSRCFLLYSLIGRVIIFVSSYDFKTYYVHLARLVLTPPQIAHRVGQSEILGRIHVAPIKIGNIFYQCSFVVLDSPNTEFLFGLDMLRKHQCIIDWKENVLRVGGEVSVPFLPEKDIPSHYLDEERNLKQTKTGTTEWNASVQSGGPPSGGAYADVTLRPNFEAKVDKLVELGFAREMVIEALKLCDGNEEQAAGILFGG